MYKRFLLEGCLCLRFGQLIFCGLVGGESFVIGKLIFIKSVFDVIRPLLFLPVFILFYFIIINNIYVTFAIRTSSTYNTLEYNKRKEEYSYIYYFNLGRSCIILRSTKKSNIQL